MRVRPSIRRLFDAARQTARRGKAFPQRLRYPMLLNAFAVGYISASAICIASALM